MSVSVIMNSYNRKDYVGKAIESVLRQQYADFEFIIVDDCSTDGTAEIVEQYARQDPRIRTVHHGVNKGATISRNTALAIARYDLVAVLDDDDIMLPIRLGRQLKFMSSHSEVAVVSASAYIIDDVGRVIGQSCPVVDIELGIATRNPSHFLEIIHPAVMYRKSAVLKVGGYRSMRLEDRDLWGRMVLSGYRVAAQPEMLIYHRRHSNSLMTTQLSENFEFGDYIDFNIIRRLDRLDEVSYHKYLELIAAAPLWERLTRKRRRMSQIAFRQATFCYSHRNWLSLLKRLALTLALTPIATTRRILVKTAISSGPVEEVG
jgi:alpha-1,3-rhamnosyltransferase